MRRKGVLRSDNLWHNLQQPNAKVLHYIAVELHTSVILFSLLPRTSAKLYLCCIRVGAVVTSHIEHEPTCSQLNLISSKDTKLASFNIHYSEAELFHKGSVIANWIMLLENKELVGKEATPTTKRITVISNIIHHRRHVIVIPYYMTEGKGTMP